jgi:hypothetical protein
LPPNPVLLPSKEERTQREHGKAIHFFKPSRRCSNED